MYPEMKDFDNQNKALPEGFYTSFIVRNESFNHLRTMSFSIKVDIVKLGWSIVNIEG